MISNKPLLLIIEQVLICTWDTFSTEYFMTELHKRGTSEMKIPDDEKCYFCNVRGKNIRTFII